MHSNRFARRDLATVALFLFIALVTTACGVSSRSSNAQVRPSATPTQAQAVQASIDSNKTDTITTEEATETPLPATPAVATSTPAPVQPAAKEQTEEQAAEPTATTAPEAPAQQAQPKPAVAVKPAVASKPAPPVRQKLTIPEPGPDYNLSVKIEGWTTYIFGSRDGERHVVAEESTRHFPGMFEKYVALSPDNRTMTYATAPDPATDRMVMWVRNIDGSNKRQVENLRWELWVARPVWSPDSKRIAYVRALGPKQAPGLELWVMNADGTGKRKLLSHPSFNQDVFYGADKNPLRWTEYGDLEYNDYKAGTIWTVNGETGELSSRAAKLKAPQHPIPVVKTRNPIPIQSQNDPRWRYDFMQPAPNSLGSYGCALAAVSMSFNAHGIPMTPKQLNKDMGDHSAIFEWGYAEYLSDYKLNISNQQWAFDWYALDLALSRGWPPLVWLSDAWTTEESLLTHWVLVVGGSGQDPNNYRIYDPWDGTTHKTLAYYTDKGYDLQKVYAYAPVPPKKAAPKKPDAKKPASKQPKDKGDK